MAIFATQDPQAGETNLGWSEAQTGTQTRDRLASILGALNSNDVLMFRGMYDYAGSRIDNSRSNLNITAAQGAGFHITDPTVTGVSEYFMFRGSNVKISNMTITSEGTAGSGFNQFKGLFEVLGAGFVMEWCKIDCDLKTFVGIGSADNCTMRRNEFSNMSGAASGRNNNSFATGVAGLSGSANNFMFEYNYSHHMPHEHIKTVKVPNSGSGAMMPVVRNNFCAFFGRDVVDSTGGFSGTGPNDRAILSDNVCRNFAILIDAKFEGQVPQSYPIGTSYTKYVDISRNKIYNCGNLICSTLTNKALGLSTEPGDHYWHDAIPEDILCLDNEVQNVAKLNLIKAGLGIVLSGTKKRGTVGNTSIFSESELAANINGATDVAAAIYDYVQAGHPIYTETGSTTHSAETVPDAPSFNYGPQGTGTEPSSDPRFVLSGSTHRTNTDLGALSARTIMAGVSNANGTASDSYTVTVS